MELFSYVMGFGTGFASNPFWGYRTLAYCNPAIGRTAKKGDWIVGLSRKKEGNRIIYVVQVDEILSFGEYDKVPRFKKAIPGSCGTDIRSRYAGNFYKPVHCGGYRQLPSMHPRGCREDANKKAHDSGCKNVLTSRTLFYYASKAIPLPPDLEDLEVGRRHKYNFT